MTPFTLHAPAKLNLSLRVLKKRPDGFHQIHTLMVKLPGLADTLEFSPAPEFTFHCDDPTVPSDAQNLVVKAQRAFAAATGNHCCCQITLKKSIPHGAGLGGGSSDAASTLIGLNQLPGHRVILNSHNLRKLAAKLGSDIPFFLTPGPAICTGRGEIITPAPPIPPLRVLLLKPSFSVATPDAYSRWQDSLEIPGIPYAAQETHELELINELERPVFQKHRFLAEVKHWLLHRPETNAALMSGSGSTVFAILQDTADSEKLITAALAELDPHLWHWHGTTERSTGILPV